MNTVKPVLRLENIVKVFPGVRALDGVCLEVFPGEVHALCGENGAGKSTLMKIIAGAQSCSSGKMYVDEQEVHFHSTRDAERKGIAMIYQEFNLLPELTVAENMYLGHLPVNRWNLVDWPRLNANAQANLDRLGLHFSASTMVRNLSVAEAQMTEIAKCLTLGARIIIMDEPTAALTDSEIQTLFAIIRQLKAEGISILYISHRMDEIFSITDSITVFRDGKYIDTKATSETNYDEIVSMMVGRKVSNLYPERHYNPADVVLSLRGIRGRGVHGVDLDLHRGEILGIVGLLGSGNIELSKMVYGAIPMTGGEIRVNGEAVCCESPQQAQAAGIGLVSDDRKQEGLVLVRNVKENIVLSSLDKISGPILLRSELETEVVDREIRRLNIKVSSPAQLVNNLSGGNQQKVVFAKVLETEPIVCILDEPTRGVDVGAKAEIYQIMDTLTREGKSIILISTDLPEVIGMSDRVLVMRQGAVVKELQRGEADQETLLAHASGGVEAA